MPGSPRTQMIASNQFEIEKLFDSRRDIELKYMEKKQKQSQDYMDEISKMLIKDSEEYHKLKVLILFFALQHSIDIHRAVVFDVTVLPK